MRKVGLRSSLCKPADGGVLYLNVRKGPSFEMQTDLARFPVGHLLFIARRHIANVRHNDAPAADGYHRV
jgi:hypothetical protein